MPVVFTRRFFKGIPESWYGRIGDDLTEIQLAKDSFYYLWWFYLKTAEEEGNFPPNRQALANPDVQEFVNLVMPLEDDFEAWWFARGRYRFRERLRVPHLRIPHDGQIVEQPADRTSLYIQIPLNIKKKEIIRQIGEVLDEYHFGDDLNVFDGSNAAIKFEPLEGVSQRDIEKALLIYRRMREDDCPTQYELGLEFDVSPQNVLKERDEALTASRKRENMVKAVRRLKSKANIAIQNAVLGRFPVER